VPSTRTVNHCLSCDGVSEAATGRAQWEHPGTGAVPEPTAPPATVPPAQPLQPAKRRQYAAGQTQAYYGGADTVVAPSYGGLGAQPPALSGGQLFTPGLAAENQFSQQQQQQQQQPQQQAVAPSYYGPQQGEPDYINAPSHGQPPATGYAAGGVGQLADQFGQMGINGQKPFQLQTVNLLTSPPDPRDLELPPPPIRLPPGACLTNSPLANAHHSYQRSTVNAIPNSGSVVGKSKIPLGLILTPYRSVKEGEEPVPVITDTIIARCRRCRTYINPYCQFIDGGNRCVLLSIVPML
jgi:protein transport protein SEC24